MSLVWAGVCGWGLGRGLVRDLVGLSYVLECKEKGENYSGVLVYILVVGARSNFSKYKSTMGGIFLAVDQTSSTYGSVIWFDHLDTLTWSHLMFEGIQV